jgi:hypothetical protein
MICPPGVWWLGDAQSAPPPDACELIGIIGGAKHDRPLRVENTSLSVRGEVIDGTCEAREA